jgi:hypothetical protein
MKLLTTGVFLVAMLSVNEESAPVKTVPDDGAPAARLALPQPGHALLDDAATQISTDLAPFDATDGLPQRTVGQPCLQAKRVVVRVTATSGKTLAHLNPSQLPLSLALVDGEC